MQKNTGSVAGAGDEIAGNPDLYALPPNQASHALDARVHHLAALYRQQGHRDQASVQTLWVRAMRSEAMRLPPADLLIVDECHHATATTWRKIIEAYPDAVLIGLTATPCRGDGRGLGGIFNCLIEAPQIPDLIELGYLVKTRVYAPIKPNLCGVRIRRGDYVEDELAERMDNPKLVGDIVTHWHKYGQRRKTVAFACNVAHSLHIRDEFVRSSVRAEHLDGETPKDDRD